MSRTKRKTFAELTRQYELPSWIKSKSHLRYSSPIEKGIAWELIKKIVHKRYKDCFTCHRKDLVVSGLKADAGHYLPVALVGSNNTLSWDLKQIRLQCSFCNGPGQGMQVAFKTALEAEIGQPAVLQIEQRRWKVDPVKDWKVLVSDFETLL